MTAAATGARRPIIQAKLRGETPIEDNKPQAVQIVRMVAIDDMPDEDGN
ncbi:MAG: hypothetical protein JOZ49_22945 [Mycolicibacterium sp.]|nr:hypothetical protein [Mycolicibacterium sp.]